MIKHICDFCGEELIETKNMKEYPTDIIMKSAFPYGGYYWYKELCSKCRKLIEEIPNHHGKLREFRRYVIGE